MSPRTSRDAADRDAHRAAHRGRRCRRRELPSAARSSAPGSRRSDSSSGGRRSSGARSPASAPRATGPATTSWCRPSAGGWRSPATRDGAPMKVGVALADVVAGKDAAIAVLAALVARARTGRGGRLVTSLAHSATRGAGERRAERARHREGGDALGERASEPRAVRGVRGARPAARDRGRERRAVGRLRARPRPRRARRRRDARDERRAARGARPRVRRDRRARPRAGRRALVRAARPRRGALRRGEGGARIAARGECVAAHGRVRRRRRATVRRPPPMLDEHGAEIRRRGWGAFA